MAAIYEPQIDVRGQGHSVLYGTNYPVLASDMGGVQSDVGDMIVNIGTSGPVGWVCRVAGIPGVWEAIGAATAAFTLTNAQILALFTTPVSVIPAQGAGSIIEVVSMFLENVFLTAAFAAGGAIGLNYTNGSGPAASATIAATFLTSPVANQSIIVAGALATNLSSAVLNVPVVITNATANFTTGAGSIKGRVNYRVHYNL